MGLCRHFHSYSEVKKFEKNIFMLGRGELKNGFYLFSHSNKEVNRVNIFRISFKQLIHLHFKFSLKPGKKTSYSYTKGGYKRVAIFDSICVCEFIDGNNYKDFKNRYLLYLTKLPYPCAKILSFDDKKRRYIMERVAGIQYRDISHSRMILDALIDYSLKTECDRIKNKYLQHGDVLRRNIVWINNDTFKFIDLDLIGFYPLLYDFIHYCACFPINVYVMIEILFDNEQKLNKLLQRFGLEYDGIATLDYIFSEYINYYLESGRSYLKVDYLFFEELNADLYPKTIESIKTILALTDKTDSL